MGGISGIWEPCVNVVRMVVASFAQNQCGLCSAGVSSRLPACQGMAEPGITFDMGAKSEVPALCRSRCAFASLD